MRALANAWLMVVLWFCCPAGAAGLLPIASETTVKSYKYSTPDFRERLSFSADEPVSLELETLPFTSPDNVEIPMEVAEIIANGQTVSTNRSIHLDKGQILQVVVTASFENAGRYDGALMFVQENGPQRIDLQVTREFVPAKLSVTANGRAIAIAGDPLRGWLQRDDPEIRFVAIATSQRHSLGHPLIKKLVKTNAETQARYTAVEFPGFDGSASELDVNPRSGQEIRAVFRDLDEAGDYEGTIMFPVMDHQPIVADFRLSVRRAWYWAAATITLGLLVAMLLRYYLDAVKPRQIQQLDIMTLRSQLRRALPAGSLDSTDRHLFNAVDQRLGTLVNDLTFLDPAVADARIDAIAELLPLIPQAIKLRQSVPDDQPNLDDDVQSIYTEIRRADEADAKLIKERIASTKTLIQSSAVPIVASSMSAEDTLQLGDIQIEKASLLQRVRGYSFLFNLGVLVVAVVLGINVLWIPAPSWGTPADYVAAFLWGLGLHLVGASTAFEGTPNLGSRFKSKESG